MQATGENIGGDTIYRVIDSNLADTTGETDLYLACSVHLSSDGNSHGSFCLEELGCFGAVFRKRVWNMTVATLSPDLRMTIIPRRTFARTTLSGTEISKHFRASPSRNRQGTPNFQ